MRVADAWLNDLFHFPWHTLKGSYTGTASADLFRGKLQTGCSLLRPNRSAAEFKSHKVF